MADGDQLASLIRALFVMRLVTNFNVASSAMFIWDYVLTFRMEVDLVWKSKWNFMKGLYLLQRYMPFIDTVCLVLYRQTGENLTKTGCRNVTLVCAGLMFIGLALSEMILTLRTWAVWNRDQRLTIILPILYVLFWGSGFIIRGISLSRTKFGDPLYLGIKGCFLRDINRGMAFLWVQLIVWNALLLTLMLIPAVEAYRDGGSPILTKSVHRDGVIYYLYLFLFSTINIVIIETLPHEYHHLLASVTRVLHSMLTSRVLLHIRSQAEDNFVRSSVMTELNTKHPHGDGKIRFSIMKRSSQA